MTVSETKNALDTIAANMAELRGRRETINLRIAEIGAQVSALRNAPIRLEDFKVFLGAYVQSRGTDWAKTLDLTHLVRPKRSADDLHTCESKKAWIQFEDDDGHPRGVIGFSDYSAFRRGTDAIGAMCFFMPDVVTQKLIAEVEAQVGSKWGNTDATPVAARRVLVAQLNEERETLEGELDEVGASIKGISAALAL